jgi:hypothetical protein
MAAKKKAARFEVFALLTDSGEWQQAGTFPTLDKADGFIRDELIGTKGVKTARLRDNDGEIVDREFNCIPVAA